MNELIKQLSGTTALELLRNATSKSTKIVFSTSFGKEDQVITHLIATANLPINIFTLDTGRLFEETYAVFDRTIKKYKTNIETYYPQMQAVQELVSKKGPYSFMIPLRIEKSVVAFEKIEPLKRAIANQEIWITGLRKEQSENRYNMSQIEWDEANNIIKIHPLFYWTAIEIDTFINENNIPINALHAKGFPSIGCSSCTRAVEAGEDERAGRWWWEASKKNVDYIK